MRKFLNAFTTPAWLLLLAHATCLAQPESFVDVLAEGHWLEVRGSYQADGSFLAQRVDLVQPDRHETLIGTISGVQEGGHFTLLGQRVEVQEKTTFGRVDPTPLEGVIVTPSGSEKLYRTGPASLFQWTLYSGSRWKPRYIVPAPFCNSAWSASARILT